jgi:hypothetical protein
MGSKSARESDRVMRARTAAPSERTWKRARALLVAGAALFALLMLTLAQPAFADSEIFPKTKLNADGTWPGVWYAEVSGDRVVWDGRDDAFTDDFDIYTWTPTGGRVNVSAANPYEDHYPRISGDRIAWQGYTVTGWDLFTWTPEGGVVQITADPPGDEQVQVSGDRIVWVCNSDYVMTWTPGSGAVQLFDQFGSPHSPQVSGDRVVWYAPYGSDGGDDDEIYMWTPAGGTVQLTTNNVEDAKPMVGGDRVVWESGGGLWTWTPSGGTVFLAVMPGATEVSNDRVVSAIGVTVYVWTQATGVVVLPITGAADGMGVHRVAYVGWDNNIYTWTPALGAVCVTPGTLETEQYPGVSGDRLVWITSGAVYTATPVPVADPTITSISPLLGPIVGGDSVVIHGTNFIQLLGASAVTFGGVDATSYVVDSDTQITAVAPEHAAGAVRVQVTAAGGVTPDTANDNYTYIGRPSITSVSPTSGSAAGGNFVAITGKDFIGLSGPSAVTFAGVDAASYTVDSATHITAVAPALVPGLAQVRVTTASGESANTAAYKYVPTGASPEQFTSARLTTNTYHDDVPSVSGDRVAWAAAVGGSDLEIFTWTPSGGTVQVTNNTYEDDLPVVSGDRIAWYGKGGNDGGSDWEIFTWRPTEGRAQVTQNGFSDEAPQIAGDKIVWMAGTSVEHDIYKWTPETGAVRFYSISGDDVFPSISPSGNRISWVNLDMGNHGTAYSWTEAGGLKTVFVGTRDVLFTVSSDDRVAVHGGLEGIYVWTEAGGTWLETGELGYALAIAGDRVVWDALAANDIMQVFSWTPSEGVVQLSTSTSAADLPQISGNRVVWQDEGASGVDSEVFSWTPTAGAYQVTSNTVDDLTPAVSGSRLAWVNLASSTNAEVYTAVAGPALPQFENTNTHLIYSPAANWAAYASTSASGGDYSRANISGSSATVYFDGTRLDWIAMKGTTTGKADVYLDDVFKTTVDLSATTAAYKVNVWSTGTIPAGVHKFSIAWNTGNASGKYITLDRVDVEGSLVHPAPTITSLSPSTGSTTGGTSVTINGAGFADVSGVTFGGANALFTVNSTTKITATAPAHGAGSVPVQVTTAAGSASSNFTYSVAPPTTRVDLAAATAAGLTTSGTWAPYTSASAYGGSYLRSSTANASVVIAFKGTQLDWITMKGTTGAIADIYVDGSATKAATINLYASPAVYQQNLFTTGTLPDGYHTVKIVRSTSSASGRYLTLDAVEVAGTLVAPLRAEETDSHFAFSPVITSWTLGSTTSASGGTYRYINTAGAYATFSFTGAGFKLIAKTAPSYGNLTVTIDGVSQTVSLYSSATTYKKVVLAAFTTPGTHTVKIARAGTKSSSSSGYTIDLDAVDLIGGW